MGLHIIQNHQPDQHLLLCPVRQLGSFRLTAAVLGHLGAISLKLPNFLTTSQDVTKGADQANCLKNGLRVLSTKFQICCHQSCTTQVNVPNAEVKEAAISNWNCNFILFLPDARRRRRKQLEQERANSQFPVNFLICKETKPCIFR